MKKTLLLLSAALVALLGACSKGNSNQPDDVIGGRNYDSGGRTYMMNLADYLVTGILDEMELAKGISERGSGTSAHFTVSAPFTQEGAVWSVKAQDSELMGLTLRCVGPNQWKADFQGDFALDAENRYPTTVTMDVTAFQEEDPFQSGWTVSLNGTRQERGGYSCHFGTRRNSTLQFINTRGVGMAGWDKVFGNLEMTVFKYEKAVDSCILSFEGAPSQATFLRGGLN